MKVYRIFIVLLTMLNAAILYAESADELHEQANAADNAEQYDAAIKLYLKADSAYVAEGRQEEEVYPKLLLDLGRMYHFNGDDAHAIKYAEEALACFEKYSEDYGNTLNLLGYIYSETGDDANVNRIMGLMDEFNKNELNKECNDVKCHLERAHYYMVSGDLARAKDEFMAVFAMELTAKEKIEAYQQYTTYLFFHRHDYAAAGDYSILAAEQTRLTDGECEQLVSLYKNAGSYFFLAKEYDKSVAAYENAIDLVDRYNYSEQLKSSSLLGLGNAHSGNRDYSKAVSVFQEWIKHLKKNGHEGDADYARAYERLASSEKFNRDYDASIADYKMAIELYGNLAMFDEQGSAITGLEMCYSYAGKSYDENFESILYAADEQRKAEARKNLKISISTLEQSGDYLGKLSTAQSYATIASFYAMLGEYHEAVDYFARYIDAIRPAIAENFLLNNYKERELLWLQELNNINELSAMIVELPENTPDLYARLSSLLYEGQLLSKGILLSSNIEFDKILSRYGTPEMMADYTAIKDNLALIEEMRQKSNPVDEILALSRETEVMQLALSRKCSQFADFTDYLKITLDDVVKALGNDAAAVEFITLQNILPMFDDNMIVAVVASKEFSSGITIPIGSVGTLKKMLDDKERFLKNDYFCTLWSNILDVLPGKHTIYFSPDGLLNNIGIEYLSFDGVPLSEKLNVVRLSSTKEICREYSEPDIKYAALFGDIDYAEDGPLSDKTHLAKRASEGLLFDNLENTGREVKDIAGQLKKVTKKNNVKLYTGRAASKNEFISQSEKPVNLLHIATHGKYYDGGNGSDSQAMEHSVLAFAGANLYPDNENNAGLVNAAEIAGLTLYDCDLVVLSACESGLGKLGTDGVFGLQRGFKNAGVKTLLVSLNEVADEATADMMIAFYRHWLSGSKLSKREALRKAQAEIRSKYPDDETWASFILIDSF